MLKRLFARWLILAIAVGMTAWLMPGVSLHGWFAPFWVSALFAVVIPRTLGGAKSLGAIGVGAVPAKLLAVALVRLAP